MKLDDLKRIVKELKSEVDCMLSDIEDAKNDDTLEDFESDVLCVDMALDRMLWKIGNAKEIINNISESDFCVE